MRIIENLIAVQQRSVIFWAWRSNVSSLCVQRLELRTDESTQIWLCHLTKCLTFNAPQRLTKPVIQAYD